MRIVTYNIILSNIFYHRNVCLFLVGDTGDLLWADNWVTFLDAMLQMRIIAESAGGLRLPTRIKSLRIDPTLHLQKLKQFDSDRQCE